MQNSKYYVFLLGICIVAAIAGVALGYFVFGPIGVYAGIATTTGESHIVLPREDTSSAYCRETEETAKEPEPDHDFILTVDDGYIIVLHAGDEREIKETIYTAADALPQEELERLASGIRIYTEEALIRILEDYGS